VDESKLKLLSLLAFLIGFAESLLVYVLSDYFKVALGSDNVSIFYFVAYVIALIGLLNMHKIISWLGKSTAFFLFFFLQICTIAFLISVPPSILGIILLMAYIISNYLMLVIFDIIIEDYSEDRKSGRIRGLHLTILNAGFILGPFLSTKLLSMFGFNGLFLTVMCMNMAIFIIGLVGMKGINHKFMQKLTTRDLFKKIFVNADLMKIYAISFVLEFFYALMIVYTPLYLLSRGMSWSQIGVVFTIMLIPFVVLEYPAGILADKKYGEKEMIIVGLLIIGISSLSIFFITGKSLWIWSGVLLSTRAGAALVEILRDSYFYKIIDGRDVDVISFFRTTRSVAYIFATAISATMLFFLPVRFVFLIIGFAVLAGLYPAFKLVDNKCEAELDLECELAN
jgi:MFS family permease